MVSITSTHEYSSIVDEPGEGWTPVRENQRREPGGFWGKSWCLTMVIFLSTRATRSGERARLVGLFQGCTGPWTAGCWLARRLHQPKVSTTMDLGISIFLIFVRCVALRNLDLLIKTSWSVICPLCCWERWSWVGDSNPSRSRLLSIWSKEVWWTVLILVGAIACRVP